MLPLRARAATTGIAVEALAPARAVWVVAESPALLRMKMKEPAATNTRAATQSQRARELGAFWFRACFEGGWTCVEGGGTSSITPGRCSFMILLPELWLTQIFQIGSVCAIRWCILLADDCLPSQ